MKISHGNGCASYSALYESSLVHKLPSMPHTHQKSRTSLFPQAQNVTKSSFQKEFNQSDFFGLIGTSDIPPFKKKNRYNVRTYRLRNRLGNKIQGANTKCNKLD